MMRFSIDSNTIRTVKNQNNLTSNNGYYYLMND